MAENDIRKEKSPGELEAVQSTQQADTSDEFDKSKVVDGRQLDDAAQYLAGHDEFGPLTPEKEKAIVRKIDAWMIPLLLFAATLGAVDKVEIGTASLYGFQTDNHMVGQQYSWLGSILPVGQVIGLIPASYIVHRYKPGKVLAVASLLWSVLTTLYAPCRNWGGLMALRFIMGFLEAAITPCLTMLIAGFYKKTEQATRNALVFAYFSSIINGFFAFVIGKIPDSAPLFKWQYLYILTGCINVLYSLFLFYILPDSPMGARFLTAEQKFHATQRLAENRTGISNRVWKWDQVWEALLDVKVWLIFLFNIVINIPNGGLVTFGSIIIRNLGFTALEASLLTMPFGVVATGGAWFFSWVATRWHNRRSITACIALVLPIIGTGVVYGLPQSNIAGQMVGLYLMYFYWPPYVVGISLLQANTAGQTKKAVSYSIVTIGYAVGALVGPQTFRANQAPRYTAGVIAMLVGYCACILILLAYWAVAAWENKNKDRKYGAPQELIEGSVEGFVDLTDRKQEGFRYTT